ncbi:MAG TPA: hypothetical protein VFD33_06650 [Bacillota bacterium]|nr:hypothetical protein [Bacillota bacterium]
MKKLISALTVLTVVLSLFAMSTIAFASNDVLVLTNCDSEDGWAATAGGGPALTLDTENKTEGKASVGATAPNGLLNEIVYKPEKAIDISGYKYIEFDMYFDDMTWFIDNSGVMVELTSSGVCDIQSHRYQKGVLGPLFESNPIEGKPGWFHMKLDLQEPHSIANGGCNLSNFNYFRFYSVGPISTTPDYTMRIDNIVFTNNEEPVEDATPEPTEPVATEEPEETASPEPVETEGPDETASPEPEETIDPEETTDPEDTEEPDETDPENEVGEDGGLGKGTIAILIVLAIAVLAGGGFALYKYVLKK